MRIVNINHQKKKAKVVGLSIALVFVLSGLGITTTKYFQSKNPENIIKSVVNEKTFDRLEEKVSFQENQEKVDSETDSEDFTTMDRPSAKEIEVAQKNLGSKNDWFVGSIKIPSINLSMFIIEKTTYENMLLGATTVLPNQKMGKNNYVLASHNTGVAGSMFTSINQVKIGDDLFLENGKETYHYRVINNYQTHLDDIQPYQYQDNPIVTLITCNTWKSTTQRYILQAELISENNIL